MRWWVFISMGALGLACGSDGDDATRACSEALAASARDCDSDETNDCARARAEAVRVCDAEPSGESEPGAEATGDSQNNNRGGYNAGDGPP